MSRNSFEDHTEIYKNDLVGWRKFSQKYSNFVYDEQKSYKEKEEAEMKECAEELEGFDYSIERLFVDNMKLEQELKKYEAEYYRMKQWTRDDASGRLNRIKREM